MRLIPRKMYLTRGLGVHKEKLTSFEMALREAGIAKFNLVRVSSIFPPHCQIVDRKKDCNCCSRVRSSSPSWQRCPATSQGGASRRRSAWRGPPIGTTTAICRSITLMA